MLTEECFFKFHCEKICFVEQTFINLMNIKNEYKKLHVNKRRD
jgi:hypothetical protein